MTKFSEARVALVTGAGSGIGRGISRALATSGYSLVLTGRRRKPLEELAADLAVPTLVAPGDVSSPAHAAGMVGASRERFGRLDLLVNNAGIARGGPLESLSDDEVEALLSIDLAGPIHMLRAALQLLTETAHEAGESSVVNISSSVALAPIKNFSVYIAAKAGLDGFTRAMALELAERRIRVNAVSPGIVETPIFETMMPTEAIKDFLAAFDTAVPLGRVGRPDDIAATVSFLASPRASYLTGAILPVDGGLSLAADGK